MPSAIPKKKGLDRQIDGQQSDKNKDKYKNERLSHVYFCENLTLSENSITHLNHAVLFSMKSYYPYANNGGKLHLTLIET